MTERVLLYHNPLCGSSRGALAILKARQVAFEVVEYLRAPLGEAGLLRLLALLDSPPEHLVRKDANFKSLGLAAADYVTRGAVAKLLAEHPRLMQRPVAVRGERAVIARPSERVESLL